MTCFLKNLIIYLGNLCRLVHIGSSIGLNNYSFPFWAYKYNFFNKHFFVLCLIPGHLDCFQYFSLINNAAIHAPVDITLHMYTNIYVKDF